MSFTDTGSSQRLRPPLWCAIIARRSALRTILRFSFRHGQRRLLLNNSLKLSTPVTFRVFGAAATIAAMYVKCMCSRPRYVLMALITRYCLDSVNVADPVSCIQFHSAATEMHDTLIRTSRTVSSILSPYSYLSQFDRAHTQTALAQLFWRSRVPGQGLGHLACPPHLHRYLAAARVLRGS